MKEIRKPLTVLQAEFASNLSNLINNSGLYPFIILPILKDAYSEVAAVAQQQLNADVQAYQQSLAESEREEDCAGC